MVNAETSALLARSIFATFSVTTETPSTLTSVTLQALSLRSFILVSNALSASVLAEISAFSASLDEVSVFNFVIWSCNDFSMPLALVTSPSMAFLFAVSAEVARWVSAVIEPVNDFVSAARFFASSEIFLSNALSASVLLVTSSLIEFFIVPSAVFALTTSSVIDLVNAEVSDFLFAISALRFLLIRLSASSLAFVSADKAVFNASVFPLSSSIIAVSASLRS